ncbi:MAG: hypothetical protein QE263_00700 [Vampirovibrionales bacterium]|nr:hypothetical protein [Vampirovibrionales bacterium]
MGSIPYSNNIYYQVPKPKQPYSYSPQAIIKSVDKNKDGVMTQQETWAYLRAVYAKNNIKNINDPANNISPKIRNVIDFLQTLMSDVFGGAVSKLNKNDSPEGVSLDDLSALALRSGNANKIEYGDLNSIKVKQPPIPDMRDIPYP